MTDPLFTTFLMPDPPARQRGSRGKPADSRVEHLVARDPALAAAFADVASGQSVILNLRPELDENSRQAVKTLLEQLIRVGGTLSQDRQEAAIAKLADIILPDPLEAARGSLAADNLALRDRFLAEVPSMTGAAVGEASGLDSRNPYATAARWKRNGDVFSVHHRGAERFPAFQFRDGRPHPAIKKVLKALPDHLSPWQRAFWFVSTNGWLDDAAPVSRLEDPDALVAAARHEAAELVG